MVENIEIQDLSYNNRDKVTSVIKGAFGSIPIAGPMVQEILGAIIPQQRLDRVVKFVEQLENNIKRFEIDIKEISSKFYEPNYSAFIYKSCLHSADAVSDERISYINNIFIRGLKDADTELVRYDSLLTLLAKLNDIELTYLYMYHLLKRSVTKFREFQELNGNITLYPRIMDGMSREEMDRENAKLIYVNNLLSLGLLEIEYDKNGKGKYKCSAVGDMLVRYINRINDD